ncbi:ectoine synthase [Actinokineospora iranica]|uniref:L-ectoine synthase n=1 Tax=Actinokineospora iranica TaxID=1271860 RepID=A0A1G6TAG5_9PSEU|nr:ectoine synthase [Actinokineospora iranica]SDD25556.1 ectoine synthase [Actinokineospora iranica]
MIVRTVDEITDTDRDVRTPNWRSKRIVLAKEGVGFSVHETTLYPGTVNDFWYANHIEAVFVVDGEGELLDKETGQTHHLAPGSLYLLDGNERHQLRPITQMRTVCVFNPPVTGREVHDEHGVYPVLTEPNPAPITEPNRQPTTESIPEEAR